MEHLLAKISKVKNSSAIIKMMEESNSPWHKAQEYVKLSLNERKFNKREGKNALLFAAFYLADQYENLKLQNDAIKEDLGKANVTISSLENSLTNADTNHRQLKLEKEILHGEVDWYAQKLKQAESKVKHMTASSCKEIFVQPPHAIQCNVPDLDFPKVNRKLPPPLTGSTANQSLNGLKTLKMAPTHFKPPEKVTNVQAQVTEYSQSKSRPLTKRCFNTLDKIKCYTCGLFGHIAKFCLSSYGGETMKPNQLRTTRRPTEAYTAHWPTSTRAKFNNFEKPKTWLPFKNVKAENQRLQTENRQLKLERDEFLVEFQTFQKDLAGYLKWKTSGGNSQANMGTSHRGRV